MTESEIITDPDHLQIVWAMIELFNSMGAYGMCARVEGFTPPNAIAGSQSDHRPDLTCWQSVGKGVPTVIECVTAEAFRSDDAASRWYLFSDAARSYRWELHFASLFSEQRMRARLETFGINPTKVWCLS